MMVTARLQLSDQIPVAKSHTRAWVGDVGLQVGSSNAVSAAEKPVLAFRA